MKHPQLQRISCNELEFQNPFGINVRVFANERVPIEPAAIQELSSMLALQATVDKFRAAAPDCFVETPRINKVSLTPDFHKARGIPVGTVLETSGFIVPQAIGNDINCGMRLHKTSLGADEVQSLADHLETMCRAMYFEAGRSIPTTFDHRVALLKNGIRGLYDAVATSHDEGLWSYFHRTPSERTLSRIDRQGSIRVNTIHGLANFVGNSDRVKRDGQIGSIGGGNHFVEFQRVDRVIDRQVAHEWGLKPGMVTVMVHTGSVSVEHVSGSHYRDKVREIYPAALKYPDNGIFVLPTGGATRSVANIFWDAMGNAANLAFANRMFLALMAWSCLESLFGGVTFDLLYDAPHNMIWPNERDGVKTVIHRKGACPARGFNQMNGSPFENVGEPVLIPGSMGSSSYILAGNGFGGTNQSAAHGAGRAMSRGAAAKGHSAECQQFLRNFRVVTPVDFGRQEVKRRGDITARKLADLKQEAPFAYKGIGPVIETIKDAGIARPVAELKPIMTVKG